MMDNLREPKRNRPGSEVKWRQWTRATLFALGASAICVLLLEAVLRFVLGLGHPVLVVPDTACEYTLKPNQNLYRDFGHTRINRYGMRADEVPALRRPDTLRVMFVGDSITYGTSRVDQNDLFTEILHRELPAVVHKPVEVLNASASAWAIDNELSYLRSRGTFDSDVVVLVLNTGDLVQTRSYITQVGDLPFQNESTAIGEFYQRFLKPRFLFVPRRVDAGDLVVGEAESAVRANLHDLDLIQELAEQHHARLAIVFTPFQFLVGNSQQEAGILRQWSGLHRVPLLDLTPYQAPFTSEQITLDHGTHFNSRGNRVVADAIKHLWPALLGV
jgi:hypothetical protein